MNDTVVDYKETLNLPQTKFPMKANLAQREPNMLKFWQQINIYKLIQEKNINNDTFMFHDGPPYANGDIHVGHALNKTLKDFVVKSKILSGLRAPFIPGWDCHGLPIELKVEKKVGKPGVKVDKEEFRKKCREYAKEQINIQRESFKRLGVLADWDNPYTTMDFNYEANIIRSLADIVKKGHVVKGNKPVYWCLDCCSSLAETEVEYKDKTSFSIYVAFDVLDSEKLLLAFNLEKLSGKVSAIIWTTTPWTLPANQAVAVNKKLTYAFVTTSDNKQYILAEELVDDVMKKLEVTDYEIIAKTIGERLENINLQHPFYDRKSLMILGDHVTTDAGTGCVHTAPAHGQDDYVCGRKYNLPVDNPVGANGCFLENVPLVGGMFVSKANDKIFEILQDALLKKENLTHSYPHCWRHKTPLIFRATSQWFVSMDEQGMRQKTLDEIGKVKWMPSWGEARLHSMIENRPDWCISRQRTWGTPLGFVIHKDTGELHPDCANIMLKVADKIEQQGMEAWHTMELKDLIDKDLDSYVKSKDTLDVWFDSGVSHYAVAEQREGLHSPADLYLEGSDQHRGWFHTSILTSVSMKEEAPYKQVLTHGYVLDTSGEKMSKSKGNVLSPQKVMGTLGADVLRLWVAASDYSADIHISEEIFKRFSDSYRRIRNTARFLLANMNGFSKEELVPVDKMLSLDKWIVKRTETLQKEIIELYNEYKFHSIYQLIHNFCIVELGGFYLDIIKDRQYTCNENGVPRKSAQSAIYYITQALVRWIAPILSFTAEEIWQELGNEEQSVFLTTWFKDFPVIEESTTDWEQVFKVKTCVNKELEAARANQIIGSALEANVTLYVDNPLSKLLSTLESELKFILITSNAKLAKIEDKENANATEMDGLFVSVEKSEHEKCVRCWHRVASVNTNKEYPGICSRCVENISTEGEKRLYA